MAEPSIFNSIVIDAPIEKVWAIVRDFNGLPFWHPSITASEIEEGKQPDQVGCVRKLTLSNGFVARQQLIFLNDQDFSINYKMIEGPFKFRSYQATIRCRSITMMPGKTFVERYAYINAQTKEEQEETKQTIQNEIHIPAFKILAEKLRES